MGTAMSSRRSAALRDAQTLGLVLREARIERGLTQGDIAQALDVHRSYVVELEAGKSVKAVERLLEFAREVGLVIRAEPFDD